MNENPQAVRLELDFTGTGLQFMGWGALAGFLSAFIIPAAWGNVPLYAWFIRNIRTSDGTEMQLVGRPKELWVIFAALILLSYLPRLGKLVEGREKEAVFDLTLLLIPLTIALWLAILRWAISRIQVGDSEPELRFSGGYLDLLGWQGVLIVSWVTVIGWAWAWTGFCRWITGNIESENLIISFEGRGASFLWRGTLALLPFGLVLILPALSYSLLGAHARKPLLELTVILAVLLSMPWIMTWLMRWFVRNTYIYRRM